MAKFWAKAPEPSPALSAALANLDRLARQRPELESAARTLGPVLIAIFLKPFGPVDTPLLESIDPDQPLFSRISMSIDLDDLAQRVEAIALALRPTTPSATAVASQWIMSPTKNSNLARAVELAIHGRLGELSENQEHGELCTTLLRLGLLPQLGAWTLAITKARGQTVWNRGECPHCGGPPLLAETRGLEAKRYLRCGLCAADWPFARLRCPACDSTDHRQLSTKFAEGEGERYKLALCSACGYQIKVVSTLDSLAMPSLLVAELATLHLDYLPEIRS